MHELPQQGSELVLMREMGVTEQDIDRRKKLVGLGPDDLGRIASLKDVIRQHVEEFTAVFFNHLASIDEGRALMANRELFDKARRMKSEHLVAMAGGEYGSDYVAQRVKLALLYSRIALEPRIFLGAFHTLFRHVGTTAIKHS